MTQKYHVLDTLADLSWNIKGSSSKDNREEFVNKVRDALRVGDTTLVVNYYGKEEELEEFITSAVDDAFLLDDTETTDDFDYLKYKYKGMHVDMRGFGSSYKVTYEFSYLETNEQTNAVNKKIKEIIKLLDLEHKTEYEKIKLIHDYIITNSVYDISTYRNTAYDCLIEKTSACQGYAALTYKMMEEAGIPCRIISGSGLKEPHAWNIVKLDGLWYNIDCTWDDPVGAVEKNYVGYDYFLKSNADFKDHTRDLEYNTDEFNQEHVMSGVSYGKE
jgi:transglutaminase-like putative cysteine protease